jgi:hypothetical protein
MKSRSCHGPLAATWIVGAVLAVWLAVLVVPPVMLVRARQTWLASLEHPEEQARWDAFRSAMRQQSGREGPVQRKVPKSAEPPLRVWLRDRMALAVAAWLLFVGVLGGFFCLFVTGVLRAGAAEAPSLAQDQPRRHDDAAEQQHGDPQNA